jgi:hypothetical protein
MEQGGPVVSRRDVRAGASHSRCDSRTARASMTSALVRSI